MKKHEFAGKKFDSLHNVKESISELSILALFYETHLNKDKRNPKLQKILETELQNRLNLFGNIKEKSRG